MTEKINTKQLKPVATALSASIDSSTFVMTLQLKDQNNNNIGSAQTIDLPIETMVVSGSYDADNKKIVLTLQNGQTIEIPVGDLISGLQTEITSDNMLDADLVDDTTSTNKFVTASDKTTWNAKQDALTAGTNITITGTTISATDTTYTGSDGVTLAGTNFTNSGVRSVASGTANGTISVNTGGTTADVSVTGLGSAAYTSSTDYDAAGAASTAETNAKNYADGLASNYATAAQGAKADTAVQPGDLASYVTKDTTQTITGEKVFSGIMNYSAGKTYILAGNGGTKLGYWSYDVDGGSNITLQTMTASTRDINFKTNNGGKVTYNGSEIAKVSAIPTAVSQLANDAGYLVMSDLTNFVTRTTAQTISGLKTFSADIVLSDTTSIKNTTSGVSYTMLYRDTSGIHVGTSTQALLLAGSGTHPSFNGNNLALLSEIPTTLAALTGDVAISSPSDGQSLIYDGNTNTWKNVSATVSISFAAITGSPEDNTALANALNAKSGCILRRW